MAVYKHPLNEKARLFMRLSYLMKRFNFHLQTPTPENCQAAVVVLLELYNLSSRLDLKSAALHMLDLQIQAVKLAEGIEGVDAGRVRRVLDKLENNSKHLYGFRGQLGQHIKSHNFLNILKQRASIAGGINDLDIPLFNHWLNLSEGERTRDLKAWVKPYEIAYDAVELLMDLINQGIKTTKEIAIGGFYQASLSHEIDYQFMSIDLGENEELYPEISAGKQRISIRFVDATNLEEKGKQILDDVKFTLNLYSI